MADFKSISSSGKITKFANIDSSGKGLLSGNELLFCIESRNHNALCVSVEEDGTTVLCDDRTFRLKPFKHGNESF